MAKPDGTAVDAAANAAALVPFSTSRRETFPCKRIMMTSLCRIEFIFRSRHGVILPFSEGCLRRKR
jgi:hypothetical protein